MKLRNVLAVVAASFTLSIFAVGCGDDEAAIKETSVSIVNDLIEQNELGDVKCTEVILKKKVGDNEWEGVAKLDNGQEIDIDITRDDDNVNVDMTRGLEKAVKATIEATSVDIVNDILNDNVGSDSATCTDVEIKEKVGDNKWEGVAKLDNGQEIDIDITRKGDKIFVDMRRGIAKKLVEASFDED